QPASSAPSSLLSPFQSLMSPSGPMIPFGSNVYYLQDYCTVCRLWPGTDLLEPNTSASSGLVRVPRSDHSSEEVDYDHARGSDHHGQWKRVYQESRERSRHRLLSGNRSQVEH